MKKTKITDLEKFTLEHIFRPYQTMIMDENRLEKLPMPLDEVALYADANPEWWDVVHDRIKRIGFYFPNYINHEIVDLVREEGENGHQ